MNLFSKDKKGTAFFKTKQSFLVFGVLIVVVAPSVVYISTNRQTEDTPVWQKEFNDWKKEYNILVQQQKDDFGQRKRTGNLTTREKRDWAEEILEKPRDKEGNRLYSGHIFRTNNGDWVKYTNATSSISFSFPQNKWALTEWPDSQNPDIVSRITLLSQETYIRFIRIHLTNNPAFSSPTLGVDKRWQNFINTSQTVEEVSVGNKQAFAFFDIQTDLVDGGVPVFGRAIFVPEQKVLIVTSEYESDPHIFNLGADRFTEVLETISFNNTNPSSHEI